MDDYPRLLVISYNSFLSSDANGRTLINLIQQWPKQSIAQIYMSNDVPDYYGCEQYYRVTDVDAFHSFAHNKPYNGNILPALMNGNKNGIASTSSSGLYDYIRQIKTRPIIKIIRRAIWSSNKWKNDAYYEFLNEFKPEIILLFSGNNTFIDHIAWDVADHFTIPIVLYNCEDYYLKPLQHHTPFGIINHLVVKKTYRTTMRRVSGVIYNSPKLQHSFSEHFNTRSIVLLNPASTIFFKQTKPKKKDTVVYLGNIAIGRDVSLCEIANELAKRNLKLHVYGRIADHNSISAIEDNENIVYHGTVDYKECCQVMMESSLIVHCESFSTNVDLHLKHAFSTKIADCLACGTPLFVYAPNGTAVTEYLIDNEVALVASSKEEMSKKLASFLDNKEEYRYLVENAQSLVKSNHNPSTISSMFIDYMCSVIEV